MLEYCTLPRTGALEVIFDVLGPTKVAKKVDNNGFHLNHGSGEPKGITKICDVTIAYPDGGNPLDLFQIVFGSREPCTTHVHYRIFDVKDVSHQCFQFKNHFDYVIFQKLFLRLKKLFWALKLFL